MNPIEIIANDVVVTSYDKQYVRQHEIQYHKTAIYSRLQYAQTKLTRIRDRNLKTVEIPRAEAMTFIDEWHTQGYDIQSNVNIALTLNDQVVSVAAFVNCESPVFSRFCSRPGLSVMGGMSKVMKYFKNAYNPRTLRAYTFDRWGTEPILPQLGFKKVGLYHSQFHVWPTGQIYIHFRSRELGADMTQVIVVPEDFTEWILDYTEQV